MENLAHFSSPSASAPICPLFAFSRPTVPIFSRVAPELHRCPGALHQNAQTAAGSPFSSSFTCCWVGDSDADGDDRPVIYRSSADYQISCGLWLRPTLRHCSVGNGTGSFRIVFQRNAVDCFKVSSANSSTTSPNTYLCCKLCCSCVPCTKIHFSSEHAVQQVSTERKRRRFILTEQQYLVVRPQRVVAFYFESSSWKKSEYRVEQRVAVAKVKNILNVISSVISRSLCQDWAGL